MFGETRTRFLFSNNVKANKMILSFLVLKSVIVFPILKIVRKIHHAEQLLQQTLFKT